MEEEIVDSFEEVSSEYDDSEYDEMMGDSFQTTNTDEELELGGIYQIKYIYTNKPYLYFGRTICFKNRMGTHLAEVKKGTKDKKYNVIRKYQPHNFQFSIVEVLDVSNDRLMIDAEQKYLDWIFNTGNCDSKYKLNVSRYAQGGGTEYVCSDEICENNRKRQIERSGVVVKTLNVESGMIEIFESARDLFRKTGICQSNMKNAFNTNRISRGYKILSIEQKANWNKHRKQIAVCATHKSTGEKIYSLSVSELCKKLNLASSGVYRSLKTAICTRNWKISYTDTKYVPKKKLGMRNISVYKWQTNELISKHQQTSAQQLSKIYNCDSAAIGKNLRNKISHVKQYVFREYDND